MDSIATWIYLMVMLLGLRCDAYFFFIKNFMFKHTLNCPLQYLKLYKSIPKNKFLPLRSKRVSLSWIKTFHLKNDRYFFQINDQRDKNLYNVISD